MKTTNVRARVAGQTVTQFPIYSEHAGYHDPDTLPVVFTNHKPDDTRTVGHRLEFAVDAEVVAAAWVVYDKPEREIDAWDAREAEKLARWRKAAAVTPRQARLALLQTGLLSQVDAALASIPDETQRLAAQTEWEYATEIKRTHEWVVQLAQILGLSDAQLDALFKTASSL